MHDGCDRLHDGCDRLHDGCDRLHDGCDRLHDGCDRLHDGCDRLHDGCDRLQTWAARYNAWLPVKLMPKGVVFSVLTGRKACRRHSCSPGLRLLVRECRLCQAVPRQWHRLCGPPGLCHYLNGYHCILLSLHLPLTALPDFRDDTSRITNLWVRLFHAIGDRYTSSSEAIGVVFA